MSFRVSEWYRLSPLPLKFLLIEILKLLIILYYYRFISALINIKQKFSGGRSLRRHAYGATPQDDRNSRTFVYTVFKLTKSRNIKITTSFHFFRHYALDFFDGFIVEVFYKLF